MPDSDETSYQDTIGKAASCAILSAAGGRLMFGADVQIEVPFLNRKYSLPVMCAGLSGTASVVADYSQGHIFPMWELSMRDERRVAAALAGATSGALTAGMLAGIDTRLLRDFGLANALLLGAGSEIAGSMLWYNVVSPMLQ